MKNVFLTLQQYAAKFTVVEERPFTSEELQCFSKAEVVEGDYGLSIKFHMVNGKYTYVPVDRDCEDNLEVSTIVEPSRLVLKVLEKEGNTINRIVIQ
jgi:hypothetical protein